MLEEFKTAQEVKNGNQTIGFVRLVDTMGNDSAIVQAARVSYGAGTKAVSEDINLIRYLVRNRHTSPLEMCEIKLHIKAPMDVMRQWIRHRTANVNEYSTRYSLIADNPEPVEPENWRLQSANNKQGSCGFLSLEDGTVFTEMEVLQYENTLKLYEELIEAGVAREQARRILPLCTPTEFYWKIDLHNLFHFLNLRLHPHAQLEIRLFAEAIYKIVQAWVPIAAEAFSDYVKDAITLTWPEQCMMLHFIDWDKMENLVYDQEKLKRIFDCYPNITKREKQEFVNKLKTILGEKND